MIWGLTTAEITALSASLIALIISIRNIIINGIFNKKAKRKIAKILNQSQKLLEIEINYTLNTLHERMEFVGKQLKILEQEGSDTSVYSKLFYALLEDSYRQYDRACSLYWENKINRERFKRVYKSEIICLVESGDHDQHFYHQRDEYKNILRVYKRWTNTKISKKLPNQIKLQAS